MSLPRRCLLALGYLATSWLGACAALILVPCVARADASVPAIPDTPAGHALTAWLDALNSDVGGKLEAFSKLHAPWLSVDQLMGIRTRTGGYDLVSIEGSGSLWMVFHLRERSKLTSISGSLVVRSNDPDHVSLLGLVPADPTPVGIILDEAQRNRIVEGAGRLIQQFYVFPDVARKVVNKLQALQRRGVYRGITDGEVFAVRLSDDLMELSGDRHMGVDYFPKDAPAPTPRPRPDPRTLAASNCGFEKADHYPPNIGYLKLNSFAEPDFCTSTAIAAMTFLADSDAIIIDLRENHGGAPHMAAVISSYLFDEPTHLDDIYDHTANTTEQLWTFPYLPGKKLTGKPVYVLTSSRTFSVAEEFSFDLKNLKRVTLVGETTGGGAHPVAPHQIDAHFFIRVPFGRFLDPLTRTDWEGRGVEPDIKVPSGEALDEALKQARQGR